MGAHVYLGGRSGLHIWTGTQVYQISKLTQRQKAKSGASIYPASRYGFQVWVESRSGHLFDLGSGVKAVLMVRETRCPLFPDMFWKRI